MEFIVEFTSNVYIKGKDLKEIRMKFESIENLFGAGAMQMGAEITDISDVIRIDDESYSSYKREFNNIYGTGQDSSDVL